MRAQLLTASLMLSAILVMPVTASAAGAPGNDVVLRIDGGRVWLKATNATIGQVLNEWSRIGQTRIVNGDRVPGGPVTLQLENVSEEEALDVLLRSAAGFMGVRRAMPLAASSAFDRILILPKGTTPTNASAPRQVEAAVPVFEPPPPETQPAFMPGIQRVIGPDGQPVPDDQDNDSGGRGPISPASPDASGAPAGTPDAQPAQPNGQPGQGSATPGMPAGVAVPGMTVPAPRTPNPNQNQNQDGR